MFMWNLHNRFLMNECGAEKAKGIDEFVPHPGLTQNIRIILTKPSGNMDKNYKFRILKAKWIIIGFDKQINCNCLTSILIIAENIVFPPGDENQYISDFIPRRKSVESSCLY